MGMQFVDVPGQPRRRQAADWRTLILTYDQAPTDEQYNQDLHRMGQRILDYCREFNLQYAGQHRCNLIPEHQADLSMKLRLEVSFIVKPKPQIN